MSPLDPYSPPLFPCLGLQQGIQLVLCPSQEANTPLILVVFLSWEGVEGRDLNLQVLWPSATLLRTNRPWEPGAVEINPCLLTSCVWSILCLSLLELFSSITDHAA